MGRKGAARSAVNLSTVRTIGFALVVIGFLMPLARNFGSGFERINTLMGGRAFGAGENTFMGLLMIAVIVTAIIGLVIGILTMMSKKTRISPAAGWVVLLICIASGLIVFFSNMDSPALRAGGILILIGWIAALAGQALSKSR